MNSQQGSDVYRINDLVRTEKAGQKASIVKYASSSYAGEVRDSAVDGAGLGDRGNECSGRESPLWNYVAGWVVGCRLQ